MLRAAQGGVCGVCVCGVCVCVCAEARTYLVEKASQSVSQPASWSVSQSVSQSASQSVSQSVCLSVSQRHGPIWLRKRVTCGLRVARIPQREPITHAHTIEPTCEYACGVMYVCVHVQRKPITHAHTIEPTRPYACGIVHVCMHVQGDPITHHTPIPSSLHQVRLCMYACACSSHRAHQHHRSHSDVFAQRAWQPG